jgi:uncharacterized damage-inducible protein DinB
VSFKDALLPEFDHEMSVTRSLLERAPEADFDWKPHDKSWSLGVLAAHLANIPTWSAVIVAQPELDMGDGESGPKTQALATVREVLERFDRNVADARKLLTGSTDGEWLALWTFKKAGQVVFTLPRIAAFRSFVMNHSVHHRGQFSVYLRLRNVPVPAMYGPSADEG